MTIKNYDIIEKILYYISLAVAFEVLFIAFFFYRGRVSITRYNMAFSYGCLMPMVVLFSRRKTICTLLALFLFIVILGIGSRGAPLFFVIYILGNYLMGDKKKSIWIIGLFVVFIILSPYLADLYESLGINSRIFIKYEEGTLSDTSGRDYVWTFYLNKLWNQPMGIGLYGDRGYLDMAYCHNLLLEILLDFGIVLGGIILIYLMSKCISVYKISSKPQRRRIWLYVMAFVAPLMLSESYLQTNSFFVAVGLMYLLEKEVKMSLPSLKSLNQK